MKLLKPVIAHIASLLAILVSNSSKEHLTIVLWEYDFELFWLLLVVNTPLLVSAGLYGLLFSALRLFLSYSVSDEQLFILFRAGFNYFPCLIHRHIRCELNKLLKLLQKTTQLIHISEMLYCVNSFRTHSSQISAAKIPFS